MKIVLAASWVPFIRGGGELHVEGLQRALEHHGHQVELLRLPLRYDHDADVLRAMQSASALRWTNHQQQGIDRVISLQFPAWGVEHPDHWAWVMHQHRRAYELAPESPTVEQSAIACQISDFDTQSLGAVQACFANSARVAERLQLNNGITASVLHHPPPHAERLFSRPAMPYIFFPSRLESLKRQSLVIEAAVHLRTDIKVLMAGEGGQAEQLQQQIDCLGVSDRVRLLGRITHDELCHYYAHSLAVLYPPIDEDYGYVTLEAMLSSKPVISCHDSGGPLAFIEHGYTGWLVAPEPVAIAQQLDWLMENPQRAMKAGRAARERIAAERLSWQQVVSTLTTALPSRASS